MKDYMNDPNYSEFQIILDEEFAKSQSSIEECFEVTLKVIRKCSRSLNDDDCFKYTEKLRKWFGKVGV
jgi:hypothetical protein